MGLDHVGALIMPDQSYALFDTAIGACGIVWTARGIVGVQLPEKDTAATRARLRRRHPLAQEATPPADIERAIAGIARLLAGERCDLTGVIVDDAAVSEFNRRVYAVARAIAPGSTMTYGEIAERLGDKTLAREVGQAMGENPTPLIVPCHRVLAANGRSGGFSGAGGVVTKLRLLSIEGAQPSGPTLFEKLPLAVRPRAR
jgi:methylated-DNA-[protein]-cysteine S-methyltransferase